MQTLPDHSVYGVGQSPQIFGFWKGIVRLILGKFMRLLEAWTELAIRLKGHGWATCQGGGGSQWEVHLARPLMLPSSRSQHPTWQNLTVSIENPALWIWGFIRKSMKLRQDRK